MDLRVPDDGTFRFYVYEIVHGSHDGEWVVATTPLTYFALPAPTPARIIEYGGPSTAAPVYSLHYRCVRPAHELSMDARMVELGFDDPPALHAEIVRRVQSFRGAGELRQA